MHGGDNQEAHTQGLVTDQEWGLKEKKGMSASLVSELGNRVHGKASCFLSVIHTCCKQLNNVDVEEVTNESSLLLFLCHP